MLRHDGLLNWRQVVEKVAYEVVLATSSEANRGGSAFDLELPRLRVAWVFSQAVKHSGTVYLLDVLKGMTAVDAKLALYRSEPVPTWENPAHETDGDNASSVTTRYLNGWNFVDYSLGTLSIPTRFSPRWFRLDMEARRIADALRPFNNRSLAFNPDVITQLIDEFIEESGSCFEETPSVEELPDQGRSSLEDALRCFRDAYPDGKGKATWPEVEKRTGYSRRTLIRAFKRFRIEP